MLLWIQLHDLSFDEKEGVSIEQAKQALASFDWQSELAKRDQGGDKTCDPGLGLVADDGSILHICPQESGECFVLYHYNVSKKLLGFIPATMQATHHISSCSLATAAELIDFHFAGDKDEILKVN